ncbi:MAG: serine hydrolase [Chloroflexi bacterium]|nr:serine hydrolase [Chloroflexota bacterium]
MSRILPRPSAGSFTLVQERPDARLAEAVRSALGADAANASVAIVDLRTGAATEWNANLSMPAASLFKLPLLAAVLDRFRTGALRPEQKLTILQSQWTDGAGVLQARVGDQLSVEELLRFMIQDSDNIAARVLLDEVGADRVNALAGSMGLTATRLADRESGEGGDHLTSARDVRTLLERLAQGQVGDAAQSERGLRLLELPQAQQWLATDLPGWARVAHKWGAVSGYQHDAGVVSTPRSTFAVVVMTRGLPPGQAASAIARVGRAAFDTLAR